MPIPVSDIDNPDSSGSDLSSDSDANLDIHIPEGPEATIVDYKQAVKRLQLLVTKLQDKVRDLKNENADLQLNQRKRRVKGAPKELSGDDERIALLGRKYSVMVELFTPSEEVFKKPCPSPAPPFNTAERYQTKASADTALLLELHAFVADENLVKLMKSTHFYSTFSQASISARATILNTLRDVMGKVLGLPGEYFETEYDRGSVPEIRAMLGVTTDHPGVYPLLFPALYPDSNVASQKLFGNWQVLAKILKAALFGPKSIQVSKSTRPGRKTYARIWDVTTLTPGAIAWAIVVLLFFLLPDTSFPGEGIGVTSQIPYKERFGQYKTLLIQRWDTARVRAIVTSMSQYIFGAQAGFNKSGPRPSSGSIVAELDVALAQLDLDVDEIPDNRSSPPSPIDENDPLTNAPHTHHLMPPPQDAAEPPAEGQSISTVTQEVRVQEGLFCSEFLRLRVARQRALEASSCRP
ncbi:hypothetical protein HYDPIDRAFT_34073 [Hydnomerulius pinastri MD-312]|uniref:Uncharacterized protein n=1 Tax=Hydnomerulius pinastri MD-312 TaxID=994086 RepID=A0A0C9VLQ3_9AGAM|nr:hypothetical protein HYDPIDRAFT_34073 [Hydnomerulius pinastri MD-312]